MDADANGSMTAGFDYKKLRSALAATAAKGVRLGTSSWKYPGWMGTVYDEQNYLWRGKVSEARFARDCLAEYALLFPTVCVDAAYYRFPDRAALSSMAAVVPAGFQFSFKVTADVTIKRFPQLPRYGAKGGTLNPCFLDPELFQKAFLEPCQAIKSQVGLLILAFPTFHPGEFHRGRDFMEVLGRFFADLPSGWDYGVELRNRRWLHPEYFSMLAGHRVTHVFNSWADMPSVAEQWDMPGSITNPECIAARLLLKPGRNYQEAVDAFQPYNKVHEVQPEVRATAAAMVRRGRRTGGKTWLYVNNRLEGNAPRTIAAVTDLSN